MQKKNGLSIKITALIVALSAVFAVLSGCVQKEKTVMSDDTGDSLYSETTITTTTTTTTTKPAPEIQTNFTGGLVYSVTDDFLMYSKDADLKTAPASLTKLVTAYTALKYLDAEDTVTAGSELSMVHFNSTLARLQPGDSLSFNDILYGLLLPSGNDAAYTIAVNAARKSTDSELSDKEAVELFVKYMNESCMELGMTNSHFATPDGWDDPTQFITAGDLLKVIKKVIENPMIKEIIKTPVKACALNSNPSNVWINTNRFLRQDDVFYSEFCVGIKTGTTDNAKCCLSSMFEKDGKEYIIITLGCPSDDDRYSISKSLFEWYSE